MTDIYSVKIKQLRLSTWQKQNTGGFDFFPFDRMYLVREKNLKKLRKLFRYYLLVEVDGPFREAIQSIVVQQVRDVGIKRDDEALKWSPVAHDSRYDQLTFLNRGKWTAVIPTFANRPEKKGQPITLAYTISNAVAAIHNMRAHLPKVSLQTPHKLIPAICAICVNAADYYANTCSPARGVCKEKIKISNVPWTDDFKRNVEESVIGSGEV